MVDDLNGLGRPGDDSKLEMDNAKYQAWQSGFKARGREYEDDLTDTDTEIQQRQFIIR
nr:IpaD/SipD/SspD family type III secretion system needle tip protein [Escherichia coli]